MASHFRPLLLPARARGTHFLLPLGSVILQLGVPQVTVKADWPAAFSRLATEKGSRWAVVAVSADPASGLAVAVDSAATASSAAGLAVAADSAATVSAAVGLDFSVAADLDFFAVSVCPFAAATEKGTAAVAISCFLAPRSSS